MSDAVDSRTQIEANKAQYQRQKNFDALKNGLIKKYIEDGLDLKDRQQESIFKLTDTRADDYSLSSGYFHACTAFGKTYLMIAMAEGYRATKADKKIIIFEENTNVLEQVREDFIEKTSFSEYDVGTYYSNGKMPQAPIIICTYASMQNMVSEVGKENIGMVLCDEAHHGLSDKRQKFIKTTFSNACLYGFTGTPEYNANKTCKDIFSVEIDKVDIKEGVRKHLLCGVKSGLLVSRIPVDLSKIRRSGAHGDFDERELMEKLTKITHKQGIKEALVEFYLNGYDDNIGYIKGKPTIINVPSKKEAEALVAVFNKKVGKTIAKAYHSDTTKAPLREFDRGDFPVLVQVNRISEGYNNPKVEICINYPTASLVRETQCCGRTLRYDDANCFKLALVLDIAFMQNPDGNVLDEVAKNGQVLFQDVAGDYYITSKEYEEHQKTKKAKEKQEKSDIPKKDKKSISEEIILKENSLFSVKLNVNELFMLNWGYEKLQANTYIPEKKANDITQDDFERNYTITNADGSVVSFKDKYDLFKQLVNDEKLIELGIVAKRKSYARVSYVIIGDKLAEFNQQSGYHITEKDYTPEKKANDISQNDFERNYTVVRTDGSVVVIKDKSDLFKQLVNDEKLIELGVVAKRKSSTRTTDVIVGDKLAEFNQYSGYYMAEKKDRDNILEKKANDINQKDFEKNYTVICADGMALKKKDKSDLFKQLIKDERLIELGIIAQRRAGQITSDFIIGDKLVELNQYSGYHIIKKEEDILKKKANDITQRDFEINYTVTRADGTLVLIKDKSDLFKQLIKDERLIELGIIAKRKSGTLTTDVIVGDKLEEFNQYSDYTISSKKAKENIIPLILDNFCKE